MNIQEWIERYEVTGKKRSHKDGTVWLLFFGKRLQPIRLLVKSKSAPDTILAPVRVLQKKVRRDGADVVNDALPPIFATLDALYELAIATDPEAVAAMEDPVTCTECDVVFDRAVAEVEPDCKHLVCPYCTCCTKIDPSPLPPVSMSPRGPAALLKLEALEAEAASKDASEVEPEERNNDEEADKFNPELRAWLNERDHISDEWPYDVPESMLREADAKFGGGFKLDENGWPIKNKPEREEERETPTRVAFGTGAAVPTNAEPEKPERSDPYDEFVAAQIERAEAESTPVPTEATSGGVVKTPAQPLRIQGSEGKLGCAHGWLICRHLFGLTRTTGGDAVEVRMNDGGIYVCTRPRKAGAVLAEKLSVPEDAYVAGIRWAEPPKTHAVGCLVPGCTQTPRDSASTLCNFHYEEALPWFNRAGGLHPNEVDDVKMWIEDRRPDGDLTGIEHGEDCPVCPPDDDSRPSCPPLVLPGGFDDDSNQGEPGDDWTESSVAVPALPLVEKPRMRVEDLPNERFEMPNKIYMRRKTDGTLLAATAYYVNSEGLMMWYVAHSVRDHRATVTAAPREVEVIDATDRYEIDGALARGFGAGLASQRPADFAPRAKDYEQLHLLLDGQPTQRDEDAVLIGFLEYQDALFHLRMSERK